MEPTLHCATPAAGCEADEEDRIFAVPYGDDTPQRGDIVVFQAPPRARNECGAAGLFVKRVIGLPRERWEQRDGVVFVDGTRLAEPYVHTGRRDSRTLTLADLPPRGRYTRIPEDMYLILGDNRSSSCDSRIWGFVPLENIRGKVVEIRRGSERIKIG